MVSVLIQKERKSVHSPMCRDLYIHVTKKPSGLKVILVIQAQFTTGPQTPRFAFKLRSLISDLE